LNCINKLSSKEEAEKEKEEEDGGRLKAEIKSGFKSRRVIKKQNNISMRQLIKFNQAQLLWSSAWVVLIKKKSELRITDGTREMPFKFMVIWATTIQQQTIEREKESIMIAIAIRGHRRQLIAGGNKMTC
jgi:hypothetical protein